MTRRIAIGLVAIALSAGAQAAGTKREFGYLPMSDGSELAYVAYVPEGKGPFPTVLVYDPYDAGGSDAMRQFVDHGYAYVGVNVRGTGCSTGAYGFFDKTEIDQGVAVLDWIGRRRWSSKAVVMWGSSYSAHTAMLVAARNPKPLKAIAAASVTRNLYDDTFYRGGMQNSFVSGWAYTGQPTLARRGVKRRLEWGDRKCRAGEAADTRLTDMISANVIDHPTKDAFWNSRSVEKAAVDIRVPTLLGHAWQDPDTAGGADVFGAIRAPKRLIAYPGGHSFGVRIPEMWDATVAWFDHFAKGTGNGAEKQPAVTVLWDIAYALPAVKSVGWRTTHASWPAPGVEDTAYFLRGDGGLGTGRAATPVARRSLSYNYPLGAELTGSDAQFATAAEPSGIATYRTEPFTSDTTLLGTPTIDLWLSSTASETSVRVVLHDIYPNGDVQYLADGLLNASMRGGGEPARGVGRLRRNYSAARPLIPGQPMLLSIPFGSIGAVIRAGHRLELQVMAPSAIPQESSGAAPVGPPSRNTVYHSGPHASRLTLPVWVKAPPPGPAADCDANPAQPCRKR